MTDPSTSDELPRQLRDLADRTKDLPVALRDALQACLLAARANSTPEQVLSDAFAQLGYLPEEAKQTAQKLLANAPENPSP